MNRAINEGFYSHYARYEFDAKYRRDCQENGWPQQLYLRRYDKKSRREWFEPAENFVLIEEMVRNRGRVPEEDRSATRKGDEGPESTWMPPTAQGRAVLEARDRPVLSEGPTAAPGGRSSRREE